MSHAHFRLAAKLWFSDFINIGVLTGAQKRNRFLTTWDPHLSDSDTCGSRLSIIYRVFLSPMKWQGCDFGSHDKTPPRFLPSAAKSPWLYRFRNLEEPDEKSRPTNSAPPFASLRKRPNGYLIFPDKIQAGTVGFLIEPHKMLMGSRWAPHLD